MEIAIIVISFILISILAVIVTKRSIKKTDYNDPFLSENKNLKIKNRYLNPDEFSFYSFMNKNLGVDMYILPKVGVDNILEPQNYDMRQYNAIKTKYLDFVIFDSNTQKPILAIDLIERSVSSKNPHFDRDISMALEIVQLNVWTKYVEPSYNWANIQKEMEKYINKESNAESEN